MRAAMREIEQRLPLLTPEEQRELLERLASSLRSATPLPPGWDTALAAMAADPEIQREIRQINEEFDSALQAQAVARNVKWL